VQPEGLGRLEKPSDLDGNRTRDLPACIIVSHPTTLPHGGNEIRAEAHHSAVSC
jgi:hypothetical protein